MYTRFDRIINIKTNAYKNYTSKTKRYMRLEIVEKEYRRDRGEEER